MKKRTIWITSAAAAGVLVIGATATAFAVGSDDSDGRDDRTAAPAAPAVPATAVPLDGGSSESADGRSGQLEAAVAAALAEVGPGTVTDADADDDSSHAYEIDIRLDAGGSVEVKLDRDLNVVSVQNDDDDDGRSDDRGGDRAIDPADRQRAIDAALAHAGGGTVTEVELSDDDDHVWEVEIDLPNGDDLDVELAADFTVVKAD